MGAYIGRDDLPDLSRWQASNHESFLGEVVELPNRRSMIASTAQSLPRSKRRETGKSPWCITNLCMPIRVGVLVIPSWSYPMRFLFLLSSAIEASGFSDEPCRRGGEGSLRQDITRQSSWVSIIV